ncbi:MAG: CvpA family protein [Candidatus Levyibacteriota bacterium]
MDIMMQFFSSLPLHLGGINFLDIIIILVVVFYAHEGYSLGFSLALLDLISFIFSFIAALKFYNTVASLLILFFGMPLGLANAVGFFLIAFTSEVILSLLARRFVHLLPGLPRGNRIADALKAADHWLGVLPGLVSAFIILSFLLSVILTFPSSPFIKQSVTNSVIGSQLIANTSLFENQLNTIFGGALNDTLNFLTVEPKSNETVQLHFKVSNGKVDGPAEQEMFRMVNTERIKQGLPPVAFDDQLRDVARAHSQDMFTRGYFSHYTLEGKSPFDRMEAAGVNYQYAGENLALAPSTPLAMQGLMNSPGHRANILSPNFHTIGIGVIDGGIYGMMFSQEFTN